MPTAVDRSGRSLPGVGGSGSHYRRPPIRRRILPVTHWNGARGYARTAPTLEPEQAQNTFMLHRGNLGTRRWASRVTLTASPSGAGYDTSSTHTVNRRSP